MRIRWIIFLFCAALLIPGKIKATHVMGAEIYWKNLGNDTFEISTVIYRRCTDGAIALVPTVLTSKSDSCTNSYLDTLINPFSHTIEDITPMCPGGTGPCGFNQSSSSTMPSGIERHIYKYKYYLGGSRTNCCWYKITWTQCCRSSNITTGYADADFFISSWLNRCVTGGEESPVFKNPPNGFMCAQKDVVYDHGATDADGDSLSYNFAVPGGGSYSSPWSYTYPFTCLGNNNPNPYSNPPTGFNLDPISGWLTFRPMQVQISVVKIEVTEWRKISGVMKVIGKTSRDMNYFVVNVCGNVLPSLSGPFSFETCVNHPICINVNSNVNNTNDTVKIYCSSVFPGATFTTTNDSVRLASSSYCWTPDSSMEFALPYFFNLSAETYHCYGGIKYLHKLTRSYAILVKGNVTSSYSKRKLNCRDYDFVGKITSSASNTSAKSIKWYINDIQVTGSTKVYPGDSLRYRFHKYGKYVIRMVMDAVGFCSETKYDTIQIDTINNLTFQSSKDTSICYGDTATLKVWNILNGTPPFKYEWFLNSTLIDTNATLKVSPKVPTWYRFELKTSDSCTDSNGAYILVYTTPNHAAMPDKSICNGDSILMQVPDTATANNYTWYFKGNAISTQKNIYVKDSGIYILKVTAATCMLYDTIALFFYPLPSHNALHDTSVCYPGGSLTLNTSNNFTNYSYTWYRMDTIYSTLTNPVVNDSGTIIVRIRNNSTGCIRYDTLVVLRKPFPGIPSPLSNKIFCTNDSALLTINDTSTSNTYQWKRNGTNLSTQKNIYAKLAGIYSVTVTSIWGCSATSTDTVSLYPLPSHTKYNNRSVCTGDSSYLLNNDSSSYTFAWYFNGTYFSSAKSIYIKTAGLYTQKITTYFGCVLWDSVVLTVNIKPLHTDIGNITICPGDTAYINNIDTITYNYVWYKYNYGSGTSTTIGTAKNIKVTDSATFYVKLSTTSGCSIYDTVKVAWYPGINHIKISNKLFCINDSAYLQNTDASTTDFYYWYYKGNLVSNSKSIQVKDTGKYIQKIQNSYGCYKYDTVRVDLNKIIYHTFIPDYSICNGDTVHVINIDTCVYNATWRFNGNIIATTKNINISSSGLYILTMTNSGGCTLTDSVLLTVKPLPTHSKLSNQTICSTDSAYLQNTDSSQYSFEWSYLGNIISTQQSIYVKNPGMYIQKIKHPSGCFMKDTINVIVNLTPTHNQLADMSICIGDSVITQNIDSSQYNFSWYVNGSIISSQKNIYVKNPGIYVLKISAANSNCYVMDTMEVILTTKPYHIAIADVSICNGDSAYLKNNYVSSNIYKWYFSGNLISTQKDIKTTTAGEYIVKVESPAGCIMFDTVEVFKHNLPVHNKIFNKEICPNDSVFIENKDSTSYNVEWYFNGGLISNQKTIYARIPGTYVNKITNQFGCINFDTFSVVPSTTLPKHFPITDKILCDGDSVLLFNIDSATYSFTWYYNGNVISTSRNIWAKAPGKYLVKIGNSGNCIVMDTIDVIQSSKPTFTVSPLNPTIIKGTNIIVKAIGTGNTYQWFGDDIINFWGDSVNLKPDTTTIYKVIASTSSNCTDSLNFTVTVDATGIVTEGSQYRIRIYPNPATKELNLIKDFTGKCSVIITDNIGNVLYEDNWDNLKSNIDISNFAEGLYIIRFSYSGNNYHYKFTKVDE